MANRKPDVSVAAVLLLNKTTGTKKQKGEDLIGDPKLKKAFIEAKKRAAGKKR